MLSQNSSGWRNVLLLAPRENRAQQKERNILEVFHHLQARPEVNPVLREQVLFQQDEVWFAHAQELGGRHPIRSDDDLVASLLCKHYTRVEGSGRVILDQQECL